MLVYTSTALVIAFPVLKLCEAILICTCYWGIGGMSKLYTNTELLITHNDYCTVKNGEFHDSLVWEFSLHPVTYNTHREFCYTISIYRVYLITHKGVLGNIKCKPTIKTHAEKQAINTKCNLCVGKRIKQPVSLCS